jgi:hypothetical protein
MKTAELTGAMLGYWVARTEGKTPTFESRGWAWWSEEDQFFVVCSDYATEWAVVGPIIDRDNISIKWDDASSDSSAFWMAYLPGGPLAYGSTALIAAMRCKVASVYGDEVPEV